MNEVIARPLPPTLENIEALEARLIDLPQVAMPVTHRFAPGVYIREIFMPAGTFVIGHQHKTEHFNIVLCGRADVLVDGQVQEIRGPFTFTSGAGVRKMLYIHEDMRWQTIHPLAGLEACGQDVAALEEALRIKSDTFQAHEARQLQKHVAKGLTP